MRGWPYPAGVIVRRLSDGAEWAQCATWPDGDHRGVALPYDADVSRGQVLSTLGRAWLTVEADSIRSSFTGWEPGLVLSLVPALATVRIDRLGATRTDITPVWEGLAFAPTESAAHPSDQSGELAVRTDRTILLPADAVAASDDRVTVVEADDPLLVDAVWRVSLVHTGPWPSERRVLVREVR